MQNLLSWSKKQINYSAYLVCREVRRRVGVVARRGGDGQGVELLAGRDLVWRECEVETLGGQGELARGGGQGSCCDSAGIDKN